MNFQKPSAEILALADYEHPPSVTMDSKKEYLLLSYTRTYKSLTDLNQEELRLGGLRINPVTNISSAIAYACNLKLRKLPAPDAVQVAGLPPEPRIANLSWSPDEKKLAFTHTAAAGVELWVIDVAAARAARLTGPVLNANLGAPVRMVLLPKESHGYAAKENILHLLWEQDRFFEKYLKRPAGDKAISPAAV